MSYRLSYEFIEKFERITSFDLQSFLENFNSFSNQDFALIQAYFSGTEATPNETAFDNLNFLLDQSKQVTSLIISNRQQFNSLGDWDLIEILQDIFIKLQSVRILSRILRSSRTNSNFNNSIEIAHVLGKNETLETFARQQLGSQNPDADAVNIAIRNSLQERDYTVEGGTNIRASVASNGQQLFINSVLDNLVGDRVLGRDIARAIVFENDDIKILNGKETFEQAVDILIGLGQGDIIGSEEIGIDRSLFVGSNIGSFAYASLTRQLVQLIALDDTIVNFRINDVTQRDDSIVVDFEAESFFNVLKKGSLVL